MAKMQIFISGCRPDQLRDFLSSHGVDPVAVEPVPDGNMNDSLALGLDASDLEKVHDLFANAAIQAWNDPDDGQILAYDSAFFPASADRIQPVRQLRGNVAAKLARKQRELSPACAAPDLVFSSCRRKT